MAATVLLALSLVVAVEGAAQPELAAQQDQVEQAAQVA
jgi:hypothetical protein